VLWKRERERERDREGERDDGDSKTLMMNDPLNSHSYFVECGMLGYTKFKSQILIARPLKLKWLRLMHFKRLRKFAKSDCSLRHIRLSVRLQQFGSFWKDFVQTWYLSVFRKSFEGIQISLKSAKNNGNLCEDIWTFMVISGWVVCRMRNVSDKNWIKNKKTDFTYMYIYIYIYIYKT